MSAVLSPVFAIDLGRHPAFVFAANDLDTAQSLVRSPRVLQAIDAFCQPRCPTQAGRLALREATTDEAALYRARADEFADDTIFRLLLVHLNTG